MDIGQRLRTARDALNYTLEKVEQATGISKSALSNFETGQREPKFSQLSRLAELYKRSIEFFLTDKPITDPLMLWRDKPDSQEEMKEIEAEFRRLCQQYHKMELCTAEIRKVVFPQPDVADPSQFSWPQAESFARKIHNDLCLGDIPSASLRKTLEERYYIKIFHLEFTGSAVSTLSNEFGSAILLNNKNAPWRRNYDLAHELFHILTWNIFRVENKEPGENEEKLADSFASKLLMPEESLKQRIAAMTDKQEGLQLEQLDDLAREFGVSLDAMVYRISNLLRIKKKDTEKYRATAKQLSKFHKPRESDRPETLPERYRDLAVRALRGGRLSLMQFAKYMGISYKKAQEYLTDDEDFTDEKISIPVA